MAMKYLRFFLAALTILALSLGAIAQVSQKKWVSLQQELPSQKLNAIPVGQKALTDPLHISVALPYRDPKGMQSFVDSVSDPKSSNYRKFITPDQVGSRFGLSKEAVKKVSDYLASQGMNVRLVGKNHLSILADASVAQAQAAFNVSIREYKATLPGSKSPTSCFSSEESPSVPAEIRSYVQYIGGLENFVRPHATQTQTPAQLRTLYSVSPLFGKGTYGQGRTVAISNWVTYGLFNLPQAYSAWNLPTPPGGVGSNVSIVQVDGSNGNSTTSSGIEGDIDIQTVLAMAPLCNLIVYDNTGDSDIIGMLTMEVDDNLADLITESYAWNGPTPMFVAAHNLHLSMSAQGITYLCAAGDGGAPGSNALYYPDEDPEVLSVGGTSVNTDASGNRISEVVWDWGFSQTGGTGGGGGWSINPDPFNLLPSYQKGNGVPTNISYRLLPDISLDADPNTGYQVFILGSLEQNWGGTSCASPTAAGALAASEQMIIANGGMPADSAGHQRLGRINDLIYSFNGDPTVFYDITSGNNGYLPNGVLSSAGPGWDTASGWGAMIFSGFVARVLNYPPEASVTLSPSAVQGGSSSKGTVTFASPVGAASATVYLKSSSSFATLPASITVNKGQASANFTVNTAGVTAVTSVTITATAAGSTQTATLTINPAALQGLSLASTTLVGGNSTTGTVTLNGPAGPGGATINLSTTSTAAITPATVVIPQGSSSATFPVTSSGESTTVSAMIIATFGAATYSQTLTVSPAILSNLVVSPTSLFGGTSATGTVSLNGTAPSGGITVSLTATSVTVPASVVIPSGSTSATFPITTKPVTTPTTAEIKATSGLQTLTASLGVLPAKLVGVSVSPTSTIGATKPLVTGTVTFSGLAPTTGELVQLTSSNTKAATVPPTVKVLSGFNSATFTVTSKAVSSTQTVTITATYGGISQTATLTVTPATLVSAVLSPLSVKGSSSTVVTGTLALSGPAPGGGLTITLLSSNPAAAIVPVSVTIPAGQSSATFRVSHKKVALTTQVLISAKLASSTVTATLTVTP